MSINRKMLLSLALLSVTAVLTVATISAVGLCLKARGDNRCSDHGDCCEGYECGANGTCIPA